MKQNTESITPLRKYIAIGYAVIALLIGGIVFIYLHEWRELEQMERESREINMLRQKVHDAYAQVLDLTLYGETVLEWNPKDTIIYRGNTLSDYIGWTGELNPSTDASHSINCGEGGSATNSTIYCYTGPNATTTDKVVTYDENGTATEQVAE